MIDSYYWYEYNSLFSRRKFGRVIFYINLTLYTTYMLFLMIYTSTMPKITTSLLDNVRSCPITLNATQLSNQTLVDYYKEVSFYAIHFNFDPPRGGCTKIDRRFLLFRIPASFSRRKCKCLIYLPALNNYFVLGLWSEHGPLWLCLNQSYHNHLMRFYRQFPRWWILNCKNKAGVCCFLRVYV